MILPFGFINIPIIFQVIINHILKKHIDKIIIIYLNNIFIFNKTLKEYKKHIYLILIALEQTNLYINIYKNIFYNQKINYLGFKIKLRIIEINNKKIETIKYWLQPTNIKEIQRFFKFVNFYQRFVKRFKRLIISFIKLTKNDKTFE